MEEYLTSCRKLWEAETSLGIMLLGQPGIGKSTLVNGLIGDNVAEVSLPGEITTEGITRELKRYTLKRNNAIINIWDTPGLLDPSIDTAKILTDIKNENENVDLYLFCINMSETRYLPGNIVQEMIKTINNTIGKAIWKKALVVLVRANVVIATFFYDSDAEVKMAYEQKLSRWRSLVTEELKDFLDDDLHIIPVGHKKIPKILKSDDNYWLSNFWEECFKRVDSAEGRISLLKANLHRITSKGEESCPEGKELYEQDIALSPGFIDYTKKVAKCSSTGAVVGAIVAGLAVSNPVGWGILAACAVGTAVGAALGTTLFVLSPTPKK